MIILSNLSELSYLRLYGQEIGGEIRVRDRRSQIYRYKEPAVTKKAFPLLWNVGRVGRSIIMSNKRGGVLCR